MLPFYAYLLKGARFIRKPLLRYRVHAGNTSLSLAAEKVDSVDKLLVNERAFNAHLMHALLMQEELDRLSLTMPMRYAQLANRIGPLLKIQIVEMAKKLVKTRVELHALGRSRQGSSARLKAASGAACWGCIWPSLRRYRNCWTSIG